jgi:hypothetical protein
MTLDMYADLFDDDLADVAERMNQGGVNPDVGRLWASCTSPGGCERVR